MSHEMTAERHDSAPAHDAFVFISYARENADWVGWIEDNLGAAGYAFFIDRDLIAAGQWEAELRHKIARCACVLVVWTTESISSKWVDAEVTEALRLNKLVVPVCIGVVKPPQKFAHLNAADLRQWQGNSGAAEWRKVLAAIRSSGIEPGGPAPVMSGLRSLVRDGTSVVDSQLPVETGIVDRVVRAGTTTEHHRRVHELLNDGFEIVQSAEQVVVLEKNRAVNWVWFGLLLTLLIIPGVLYLKIMSRLPKLERVRVTLIDRDASRG